MPKSKNKFTRNLNAWTKQNPKQAKKLIRGLHNKIFPTSQNYIDFIISTHKNEKLIWKSGMTLKDDQHQTEVEYWKNKVDEVDEQILNDQFAERDHWQNITAEEKDKYEEVTKSWLSSKTPQLRSVWNHYILGVPKKKIALLLKKDSKYIRVSIDRLEKDFMEKIPSLIKK